MPEDEYEVETILKMKKIRGKDEYLYLVKWKGYDEETWEPKSNLFCDDLLSEFLKAQVKKQKSEKSPVKGEKEEVTKQEIQVKLEKEEETIVKSEIKAEMNDLASDFAKRVKKEVKSERGAKRSGAETQRAAKKVKKEPTLDSYFKKG